MTPWSRILALVVLLAAIGVGWLALKGQPRAEAATLGQGTGCGAPGQACEIGARRYNILIPKGEGPFPAVVFFHGSNVNGDMVTGDADLAASVLGRGYALIAPTALEVDYSGGQSGTGWIWEGRRGDRDDHGFVRAVLDDATARFPIDPERLLIAGHSNGATFVWYLACATTDRRMTSFAPIGGTLVRGRPLECADVQPRFNLMHTHGTADPVVPFEGRGASAGWPGWLGAEEGVADLAARAGCRSEVKGEAVGFTLVRWERCNSTYSVALAAFAGGHEVPAGWADLVIDWYEGL